MIDNLPKYWYLYLIIFVAGGAVIARVKIIIRYLTLPNRNEEALKEERGKRKMKDEKIIKNIEKTRKSMCGKIDKLQDEIIIVKEATDKNSGMLKAILKYTTKNGGL